MLDFCVFKPARLCSIYNDAEWSHYWWWLSKSDHYSTELQFLKTNYFGWWCGLWRILILVGLLGKSNWKFKILINGCYTGLDNIPDKRKELQEPQKVMICKLLQVIPALCNQVQQQKGAYQRLKILWTWLPSTVHMIQERFSNVTVLKNPGRGTLGIIGWGSAAGTLEPIAYTRTSSTLFWNPILD